MRRFTAFVDAIRPDRRRRAARRRGHGAAKPPQRRAARRRLRARHPPARPPLAVRPGSTAPRSRASNSLLRRNPSGSGRPGCRRSVSPVDARSCRQFYAQITASQPRPRSTSGAAPPNVVSPLRRRLRRRRKPPPSAGLRRTGLECGRERPRRTDAGRSPRGAARCLAQGRLVGRARRKGGANGPHCRAVL